MSVESYIKENASCLCDKVYVAPEIPEKMLNNAISGIAPGVNHEYVLAIADTSIFGSAKEGCLFLGDSVHVRGMLEKPQSFKFENITSAEYKSIRKVKDNGKVDIKEEVILHQVDDIETSLTSCLTNISFKEFAKLINGILEASGEENKFETTSQTMPLESMENEIKKAYLKIICNFACSDDDIIDSQEYAEILSLIVRIELDSLDRLELRNYMYQTDNREDSDDLVRYLEENVPEGSFEIIKKSLLKDMIYLFRIKNEYECWPQNKFFTTLQQQFKVNDEQIDLMMLAIKNDEEILAQRKNDSEITKSMKEIAAKAGAVGVPLAAIYFSGSVVGMSAAGITSGLATLGMGGLLGLSGMVTGIGVVVIVGVGAYKGIKTITGLSDLENNKQRELMLQAIIKNAQKSLNYLIEDVNEISTQLMKEIKNGTESTMKIEKISAMLGMLSKGAQTTTEKITHAEIESIIAQLPPKLDAVRLKELTKEATKEKLKTFVLACYIETETIVDDGGVRIIYLLSGKLPLNTYEQLYSVLENIGYLDVSSAAFASIKGTAKNLFKDLIN
ncbi:hypothetical protein GH810_03900 [Acetobacterium paludosum]|uniref:ENT domain-containing protein n=1 Tax=Acetobacterium paludosum TaxID=52693 RepID=A0A923HTI4_9FIRM|nr:hypothetical protein [Acetobacterium paludosum]MBC3887447.1 hypothetical protein [Acetobacterium paludosum]